MRSNYEEDGLSSYLDHQLLEIGAEAFLKKTVMAVAPTHAAKNVVAATVSEFGIPTRTIKSAFMQPVLPPEMESALVTLEHAFTTADTVGEAPRTICMPALATLNVDPAHRDEVIEEMASSYRAGGNPDVMRALGNAGWKALDHVDKWAQRDSAVGALLVLVDESSMVDPHEAEVAIKLSGSAVFLGDSAQLPPVKKDRGAIQHVMEMPDVSVHNFTRNFRLQGEAPKLAEILHVFRDGAMGDVQAAMRAWSMLVDFRNLNDGGIHVMRSLPLEAVAAVAAGKATILTHKNVTRHMINDQVRQLLGFDNFDLQPGEYVIASVRPGNSNREITDLVQANPHWRVVEPLGALNVGHFDVAPAGAEMDVQQATWHTEFRPDPQTRNAKQNAYSSFRTSGFYNAEVILSFGYASTTHKAQGRQWPGVFLHYGDFLARWGQCQHDDDPETHNTAYGPPRTRDEKITDFAKLTYTALSRAQRKVVLFGSVAQEPIRAGALREAAQAMAAPYEEARREIARKETKGWSGGIGLARF